MRGRLFLRRLNMTIEGERFMDQDKYSDMFGPAVNISLPGNCTDHEATITDVELANAYVPFQKLCPTFSPMASLRNGTIFPGLYNPKWENRNTAGGE
jgi:hypothetical protein